MTTYLFLKKCLEDRNKPHSYYSRLQDTLELAKVHGAVTDDEHGKLTAMVQVRLANAQKW